MMRNDSARFELDVTDRLVIVIPPWIVKTLAAVVVYALSIGPVAWLASKDPSGALGAIFSIAYWPLGWVCSWSEATTWALFWYLNLFVFIPI